MKQYGKVAFDVDNSFKLLTFSYKTAFLFIPIFTSLLILPRINSLFGIKVLIFSSAPANVPLNFLMWARVET